MEETSRELVRLVSCPEKGNFRSLLSEAHRRLLLFSCLLVPLFPPGTLTGNPELELCSENHSLCVGRGAGGSVVMNLPGCQCAGVRQTQRWITGKGFNMQLLPLLHLQKCGFLSDRDFKLAQLYCPFLLR